MDVDDLLERVRDRLRTPPSCGVPHVDRVIADALRPGKLLRPELVLRSAATARGACSWDAELEHRVVMGALAMEMLHVATLVHDDIIDGSSIRRGRPSVVAAAGVAAAIVIGDLLLARGSAAAVDSAPSAPAVWARTLECMAVGQLREADLAAAPSIEALTEYASLKTAELFRASAEVGALAAEAAPEVVAAHGSFGLHFGIAFQHADDLLDLIGDARQMGKPTGTDAANGVPTAVALVVERGSIEDVAGLISEDLDAALASLPPVRRSAELGAWGASALRRTLGAALDGRNRRLTDRLTSVLDRVERKSDIHGTWELRPCSKPAYI